MKNFFKKRGLAIFFIVLIVIAIWIVTSRGKETNNIQQFTVVEKDISERIEISGKVKSNNIATLGFDVSGKIDKVFVKMGDKVKTGTPLVRLDTGTLQADLADAQARVSIQESKLRNTGTSLEIIRQKQDGLVSAAYQKLLSSGLVAEPHSSTYKQTPPIISGRYTGNEGYYKILVNRSYSANKHNFSIFGIEKLIDTEIKKTTPTALGSYGLFIDFPDGPSQYNDTIWYVYIPNIKNSLYTVNYNVYQEALRERDRALDVAELELREGLSDSIAQAELKQAKAAVSRIQAQIKQRLVQASFNGVVSNLDAEVGEIASAGKPLITIVSNNDLEIELLVPEIDVSKLSTGDIVDVSFDAFSSNETLKGEIATIGQSEKYVDGVSTYQTNVRLIESDPRIRSGLSATVTVVTQEHKNVLAVPSEYINNDEVGQFVNVVLFDGTIERRDVTTGLRGYDNMIEIIQGLSKGEILVII